MKSLPGLISTKVSVYMSGVFFFVLLMCGLNFPVFAQEVLSPRIQIGASLFPSIVAADKNLSQRVDDLQRLNMYFVYQKNELMGYRLSQKMASISKIRNFPIVATNLSQSDLLGMQKPVKGVIFIAEPVSGELSQLIEFAKDNHMILFSPFKGDVERGVAAGYRVNDKVLPMVNMDFLRQTDIKLKAFFLRISVKYEQ